MSETVALTLAELLKKTDGSIKTGPFGTTLKAQEYADSGVPIISVGEIGNGTFRISDDTPRASSDLVERLSEYLLEGGDIVFARKGAVDRSAWVSTTESGWFLGSDGIRVRPGKNINSRFLAYQFQSLVIREWLSQHASGTTMASMNGSILGRVPLTIPPLAVQDTIADVLGALDDKISANGSSTILADQLLAAALDRQISSSDVTTVALRTIAQVNADAVRPSGEHLRYIDIASVGVGHYNYPQITRWEDAPGRARRRVQRGDTLWSMVRPNRRSHALNLSNDPLLVGSTGLAVISPRTTGFAYVYQVTKLPDFTAFLESNTEGSAYPAVRPDMFESAPIPLLPEEQRLQFESMAAPLRMHIDCLDSENRRIAELRDTLLPQLMSGRLRVKDAEKRVEAVV